MYKCIVPAPQPAICIHFTAVNCIQPIYWRTLSLVSTRFRLTIVSVITRYLGPVFPQQINLPLIKSGIKSGRCRLLRCRFSAVEKPDLTGVFAAACSLKSRRRVRCSTEWEATTRRRPSSSGTQCECWPRLISPSTCSTNQTLSTPRSSICITSTRRGTSPPATTRYTLTTLQPYSEWPYSTVALMPPMSTTDVWRGIT